MRSKTLEPQLNHIYKHRDCLSTKDGLIFSRDRVFVSASMRNNMKKKKKEGDMSHLAVDSNIKCTLEYRKLIQIVNSVTNTMQETGKRLIIRPIPEYLFQCVGLDIMTLGRKKYSLYGIFFHIYFI